MNELREVKQELRSMMNGLVAQSMRQKGLNYRLIYGVELPRLLSLAGQLPRTRQLADELWGADIRECRLLALMVMPAEELSPAEACRWAGELRFVEEAEYAAMLLFAHMSSARASALSWVADKRELVQVCGWNLLARLAPLGEEGALFPRAACEAAWKSPYISVRLASRRAQAKCVPWEE